MKTEFTITASYDWVNADMKAARAAGKYIILNFHGDTSPKSIS
jgi:hypothetical protein